MLQGWVGGKNVGSKGRFAEAPKRQPRGVRAWVCRGKGLDSGVSPWCRLSVGGQGRGPEVARSVCGKRCQSRNPAPTAPPPGVSRKLPAGLSEGSPGVKRSSGWYAKSGGGAHHNRSPGRPGPSRSTHRARREQRPLARPADSSTPSPAGEPTCAGKKCRDVQPGAATESQPG